MGVLAPGSVHYAQTNKPFDPTELKKIQLLLLKQTDRRTNIVTYRAAVAAKINHPYPNHNS